MSVEPPWLKTSQKSWEQLALELRQPLFLKVAFLAYARVEANGHARFRRGELSELTGKDRHSVARAIRAAVESGWLLEGSCTECLLPPGDFIEMSWGNQRKECSIHPSARKIKRGATQSHSSEVPAGAIIATDVVTQRQQPVALSDTAEAIA